MRNFFKISVVVLFLVSVAWAINYTKQYNTHLLNSLVDNTPIGQSQAAAGTFTTLNGSSSTISGNQNVGSFQIGGGAPNGQVLMGNGSTYIPQTIVIPPAGSQIVTNTVTGCTPPAYNNLVSCFGTFNWSTPFPDTNYNIIGCIVNPSNGASLIAAQVGAKTSSGFPYVETLIMINGSGGGWTPQITCSAYHN
jgi:hypothetical protein